MKLLHKNYLLLALIIPFVLSCNDDPVPPLSSQAAGTYSYQSEMFYITGAGILQTMGDDYKDSGTFTVTKLDNGFEAQEESGDLQFVGLNLHGAANGFAFDVGSQTMTINGDEVEVSGYDSFDLGPLKYDGAYDNGTKQLTAGFKFDGIRVGSDGKDYDATFVVRVIATKQ